MSQPPARLLILAIALAASLPQKAEAQPEESRVYEPAFFIAFAPQTALEMVERLPGFTLEEADEGRGLGQGGTNVLLNGQLITGKGEAATTQIAQISARNVVQIEILDGGTLDIPGFTGLVANIVTQRSNWTGSMLWEPEFKSSDEAEWLNGNIALSGSFSDLDLSLALSSTAVRQTFVGPEELEDADGFVFERRDESLAIAGDQPMLSTSLSWQGDGDQQFNARASLSQLDLTRQQISRTEAVSTRGFDGLSIGRFDQVRRNTRLDFDYTRPALGGSLKFIAALAHTDNGAITRSTTRQPDGVRIADQSFEENSLSNEHILRLEQNWGGNGRSWQLAGEAVSNTLELDTSLLAYDLVDEERISARSESTTRIEEARGEVTLAHSRDLREELDLQLSLGAERSTLSQGAIERSFFRPKGFVAITWRPRPSWTLSARVAREVGQISFRDFATSVSLFEQVTTENNPELVPEQSWEFSARAEHRWTAGHILTMELEHADIEDLVDQIPLGASGNAIGNIPNASRTSMRAQLTLEGAELGLPGAQLELRGQWRSSSVTDPIGGFERDIGGLILRDIRADFRHDIPGTLWAYGFSLQDRELAPTYRSSLIQYRNVPPGALTPGENSVFIEHANMFGLRARLELAELLDQNSNFSRRIYDGRRDSDLIDRIETRSRELGGPHVRISLARSF
ncbi:MAG: hypothetical protein GYB36_14530 [Alphaproteobacteria bacterium]|nr:hypothetical protein [Alphaproteobacteria bacterium]